MPPVFNPPSDPKRREVFDWTTALVKMVWPADSRAAYEFESMIGGIPRIAELIAPEGIPQLVRSYSEITPFSIRQNQINESLYRGVQVGRYFLVTVAFSSLEIPISMERLKWWVVSQCKDELGAARTVRMFNDVWTAMRKIAHLWAAYVYREQSSLDHLPCAVPCDPNDIAEFLSLAEGLRILGERTRIGGRGNEQQQRRLLAPGEAVRIDYGFRGPARIPVFHRADYADIIPFVARNT